MKYGIALISPQPSFSYFSVSQRLRNICGNYCIVIYSNEKIHSFAIGNGICYCHVANRLSITTFYNIAMILLWDVNFLNKCHQLVHWQFLHFQEGNHSSLAMYLSLWKLMFNDAYTHWILNQSKSMFWVSMLSECALWAQLLQHMLHAFICRSKTVFLK